MKVRWCDNGHLKLTNVEGEGEKVAMAILLPYPAHFEKEKRGERGWGTRSLSLQ